MCENEAENYATVKYIVHKRPKPNKYLITITGYISCAEATKQSRNFFHLNLLQI